MELTSKNIDRKIGCVDGFDQVERLGKNRCVHSRWVKIIDELGAESYYDEYIEVDGIKVPHSNKLVAPQMILDFRILEIEINPKFDENIFEVN